jgi:quinol monooxygenase YgiN
MTTTTPQILSIITYEVGEEDREAFERIVGAHGSASDTYPGCLRFSLGRDVLHAGRYELTEIWRTQSDLDAHMESDAFRTTVAALGECHTLQVRQDRFKIV